MRIGVIGAGNMARVLGTLWAEKGHSVCFGSREPEKSRELAEAVGHGASGGSLAEAAAFGEVVLVAVHWDGVLEAVGQAGPLAGKVLIDCNNAVDTDRNELQTPPGTSLGEQIAAASGARVVKAFNTVFQEVFEHPEADLRGRKLSCFLCGDDPDAKAMVGRLATEIGFDPLDCGPLAHARLAEAAGALIIWLGWKGGLGANAAITAVTLPEPAQKRLGGRQK